MVFGTRSHQALAWPSPNVLQSSPIVNVSFRPAAHNTAMILTGRLNPNIQYCALASKYVKVYRGIIKKYKKKTLELLSGQTADLTQCACFTCIFKAACQGERTDGTWRAVSGLLRHHGDGRAAEAAPFPLRLRHLRRAPARSRGRATPGQPAQTGMGQSPFCVGVAKSRIQVHEF